MSLTEFTKPQRKKLCELCAPQGHFFQGTSERYQLSCLVVTTCHGSYTGLVVYAPHSIFLLDLMAIIPCFGSFAVASALERQK